MPNPGAAWLQAALFNRLLALGAGARRWPFFFFFPFPLSFPFQLQLLLALFGAGLIGASGSAHAQFDKSPWPRTQATPTLNVLDLQGQRWSSAELSGQVVVLNFWATWCAPCVEEMPLLDIFFRQNVAKGWQIVGLAIDQPSRVRQYLSQNAISYPIGLAGMTGTELGRLLGNEVGGLPFTVVLDGKGSLIQRKLGKLSAQEIQAWA